MNHLSLLTGKSYSYIIANIIVEPVYICYSSYITYVCITHSEFVNNFGDRGGALAVLHFAAYFENVTFSKHRGPVILVSGIMQ